MKTNSYKYNYKNKNFWINNTKQKCRNNHKLFILKNNITVKYYKKINNYKSNYLLKNKIINKQSIKITVFIQNNKRNMKKNYKKKIKVLKN